MYARGREVCAIQEIEPRLETDADKAPETTAAAAPDAGERRALVASVFVVGLCSIVYELLVSTTSSYFLGDSIRQFSLTIGVYLAGMGLGSYLVRFLRGEAVGLFVRAELALGLVGGLSVPLLYGYFAAVGYAGFQAVMLATVATVGTLTGLEIPLLTRLLAPHFRGEEALSNVLTLDYVGALAATLLFPFVLLPLVGVFQSSLAFGAVNVAVAIYAALRLGRGERRLAIAGAALLALLGAGFGLSAKLLAAWRDALFRDPIVYTEQTPYQSLTMTRRGDDTRLYIDRVIQWSATDEYRYHESLVHPTLSSVHAPRRVLVLGGGEGLAVREVLRHESVDSVTVVDIDPAVFRLARTQPQLLRLNERALFDPRVRTVARDAFVFLREVTTPYDAIVVDLPDPSTDAVARLYSVEFFRLCRRALRAGGGLATQATGPFHTRRAFWSIGATLREAGFGESRPYHAYVASFGEWGFWMSPGELGGPRDVDFPTRYYTPGQFAHDTHFPADIGPVAVEPNGLDRPVLLDYYLDDWRRWSGERTVW